MNYHLSREYSPSQAALILECRQKLLIMQMPDQNSYSNTSSKYV